MPAIEFGKGKRGGFSASGVESGGIDVPAIIKVDEVVFREDLYPRIERNPATVQAYAEQLENLPPIEVNQKNELIDGWHRWTAHKKEKRETIAVVVTETVGDAELLALAIERNATHGLQLNTEDKRTLAVRLYSGKAGEKEHLCKILSVPERTMRSWLSRKDTSLRQDREKRIYDMWLACYTQREIAEAVGMAVGSINQEVEECSNAANLPNVNTAAAAHADLDPVPIYNVWKQKKYTSDTSHPGNTCVQFLDNLLYLYTKPHEIVVDPFGGSGTTVDLCKKRHRRYWVSDRAPVPERESDIRLHSIQEGPPPLLSRWSDVALLYLDPPYWRQAQGTYSDDPADLSNMPLEDFYDVLTGYIFQSAAKMREGSRIALIIQPTQWRAEDRQVVDHVVDIVLRVRSKHLSYQRRISCPYESQQCTPQMVEWAKAEHELLVLTREIILWERV
jgi:hypothetical protein